MHFVEYIQNGTNINGGKSTGWMIDFNRYPTTGTMVEIKFNHQNSATDGNMFFGCHHYEGNVSANYFRFFTYQSGNYFIDSPFDGSARLSIPFQFGQVVTAQITTAPNVSITNLGTQSALSQTFTASYDYKYPMALWYEFGGDVGNVVEGTRVYYIKIYENNTLVMDLWPAVDNGVQGFYDKVGGQFYHNNDTTKQYVVGPTLSSILATPSKASLAASGETISIDVVTNNAWTVTGNTWLTLSSTGDTSGTTITATAPSYTGATARTDTLTFTDSVTGDEAEITIRQKYPVNGQPIYLGGDEINEIYLGTDTITEAYLGNVLVFSSTSPTPPTPPTPPSPTGGTRTISISSIPIPIFGADGTVGTTDIYVEDENKNYASLSLSYSDPYDETSYDETVGATQSFSASYVSGYFEVEGEWGDEITITYDYSNGQCDSIPEGYNQEDLSFVGDNIATSFPTPETDYECECINAGGIWEPGEGCVYPEPDPDPCIEDPCSCDPNPDECYCIQNGGTWDGSDCIYPE